MATQGAQPTVTMLSDELLRRMEVCASRHTLTGWYGGGEWQEMYEHDIPLLLAELHVNRAELRTARAQLAAAAPVLAAAQTYAHARDAYRRATLAVREAEGTDRMFDRDLAIAWDETGKASNKALDALCAAALALATPAAPEVAE